MAAEGREAVAAHAHELELTRPEASTDSVPAAPAEPIDAHLASTGERFDAAATASSFGAADGAAASAGSLTPSAATGAARAEGGDDGHGGGTAVPQLAPQRVPIAHAPARARPATAPASRLGRAAERNANLPGMHATRSTLGRQLQSKRQTAPAYSFGSGGGRFGDPAGSPIAGPARLPRGAKLTDMPRPSSARIPSAASPGPAYNPRLLSGYIGDAPKITMAKRLPFDATFGGGGRSSERSPGPAAYNTRTRPGSAHPGTRFGTEAARAHRGPPQAGQVDLLYSLPPTMGSGAPARGTPMRAERSVAFARSTERRFDTPSPLDAGRNFPGPSAYQTVYSYSSVAIGGPYRPRSAHVRGKAAATRGFGTDATGRSEALRTAGPGPGQYSVPDAALGSHQESRLGTAPRYSLASRTSPGPRVVEPPGALGPGPGAYVV